MPHSVPILPSLGAVRTGSSSLGALPRNRCPPPAWPCGFWSFSWVRLRLPSGRYRDRGSLALAASPTCVLSSLGPASGPKLSCGHGLSSFCRWHSVLWIAALIMINGTSRSDRYLPSAAGHAYRLVIAALSLAGQAVLRRWSVRIAVR